MSKFFTVDELTNMFSVSKPTIYRLIYRRKIPSYKISNCVRFKEEDINKFLEENKINVIK